MRANSQPLIDIINEPKEVAVSATFRKSLPVFTKSTKTDSLNLTNGAWIDACAWGTGILRVTSVGNILYTQYIADVNAAWPAWYNTGILLFNGSRPAVDAGYVWYQRTNQTIYYRYYGTWGSEVSTNGIPGAAYLAPIGTRCYALWQRNPGAYEIIVRGGSESSQYTLYGLTSMPRLDAVSFGGKDYLYTMDRDAGRIIEIQHGGNGSSGNDSYGVGKAIIPIDAIDEVYGFKLGYAGVVDNKVVVTGRLTRTSDDDPISMDVYSMGPEYFSLGRDMFIGTEEANGKLLRVSDDFVVAGATTMYKAKATNVFGGESHPDLKITTSDFANITLTEGEARSTNLTIDASTALSHTAIAAGSDIELQMSYNNNWCRLATCNLEADRKTTDEQGKTRTISGIGKSAKRLSQWAPDQGIYIPSQARMYDYPAKMTQVVRAAGQWENVTPESETSALKLNDLNKLGVLYSTARASRGGAMRGKFYYPSDTYFKPYYGVAVNYYRESAAEAAARLGVEVDELEDDMYGHNGILAVFSPYENGGGAPGIGLYLWKDNEMTLLTSVALSIPASTWHWLQIEFIEGEIRVKYRLNSSTTWTEVIAYQYNSTTLPWKTETLGRGAIVVKNIVPIEYLYGGVDATDKTLGFGGGAISFPSSGTVRIGSEDMTYNGKGGTSNGPEWNTVQFWPAYKWDTAFTTGKAIPISRMSVADNSYNGMAVCVVDGYGKGRTLRCVGYDNDGFHFWEMNNYASGWSTFIGNTAYGAWALEQNFSALYVSPDPTAVMWHGGEMQEGPYSVISVVPSLKLTARGANGTVATSHAADDEVHLVRTGYYVQVHLAASFTQDEDQSIEDALKTIVRLAGGEAACKTKIDGVKTFGVNGVYNAYVYNLKNSIATFDLPSINDGSGVGIVFRGTSTYIMPSGVAYAQSGGDAYCLEVERTGSAYNLSLSKTNMGVKTLLERVPIRPTNLNGSATANVPVGTVKVSVQDSFISVWLNGRWLHTFYNTVVSTSGEIAFISRQAATFKIHLSELNDLLADIVVGTRGNGMSVIGELLGERGIKWRDEPDGSMMFFRSFWDTTNIPDIISSFTKIQSDNVVSRVRAEGVNISERVHLGGGLLYFGNSFRTINARYANNIMQARAEADLLLGSSYENARSGQYSMDVHPGYQPGDYFTTVDPDGIFWTAHIVSQTIAIGFFGNNFVCEMQSETLAY